jgi:hypothetical protein
VASIPVLEPGQDSDPKVPALSPVESIELTPSNTELTNTQLGLTEEVLVPEAVLEFSPTEDSEVTQSPTQRQQAAQSVITASATPDAVSSSLGWTVGLTIAGALLLVAGFLIRRRAVSDLLVG